MEKEMYLSCKVGQLAEDLIADLYTGNKEGENRTSGTFTLAKASGEELLVSITEEIHGIGDDAPYYTLHFSGACELEPCSSVALGAAALSQAITEVVNELGIQPEPGTTQDEEKVYLDQPVYELAKRLIGDLGAAPATENGDRRSDEWCLARSVTHPDKCVCVSIIENVADLPEEARYYSVHVVNDVANTPCEIRDTETMTKAALIETLLFIASDLPLEESNGWKKDGVFLSMPLEELAERLIHSIGEGTPTDAGDQRSAYYVFATSLKDRGQNAIVSIVERRHELNAGIKPYYTLFMHNYMKGVNEQFDTDSLEGPDLVKLLSDIADMMPVVPAREKKVPKSDPYKVAQLKKMLEADTGEGGGYGANLRSNTDGSIHSITIGKKGLEALIKLYETESEDFD